MFTKYICAIFVHGKTQSYFVAETTMPGKSGFDFSGSSQSFNVLAEYLFGKVVETFPRLIEDNNRHLKFYICQILMPCSEFRILMRSKWR